MILACNDDGIHSDGLLRLVDALEEVDEVVVVAPDRERSAVSHALTLDRPLRADLLKPGWFAVDGTPTDCVNLAVNGLLEERPWLVVSGINRGANLGDDITYSGTVSAAMEAVLLGIPAVAVSQVGRVAFRFDAAASFSAALVACLRERRLPPDTLLNVNVPDVDVPRGYAVTRQGKRRYGDAIVEKTDPRGRKYYWIGGAELGFEDEQGTDFAAIESGQVSVTPLHLDLTNYESMEAVAALNIDWPPKRQGRS
ncbi:MAG: 5'/3'-nucleotidase SurE [Deltaproteobacteria bacterium]|nr:MAG: 5'/3'-nucleotidase SurE [Deltaproteobacteria bacterium]